MSETCTTGGRNDRRLRRRRHRRWFLFYRLRELVFLNAATRLAAGSTLLAGGRRVSSKNGSSFDAQHPLDSIRLLLRVVTGGGVHNQIPYTYYYSGLYQP